MAKEDNPSETINEGLDLHAKLQKCLNLQIFLQIMVGCLEEKLLKEFRMHRLK